MLLSADYVLQPPVSEICVRALFQTLRRLQLHWIIHRDLVRISQKKCASFTQNKRLFLYREILTVFGVNDAKRKYTVCKQSRAFDVKRCGIFTDHNALKGYCFTGYIIPPFSEHAVSIPAFCLSLVTSTSRPLGGLPICYVMRTNDNTHKHPSYMHTTKLHLYAILCVNRWFSRKCS